MFTFLSRNARALGKYPWLWALSSSWNSHEIVEVRTITSEVLAATCEDPQVQWFAKSRDKICPNMHAMLRLEVDQETPVAKAVIVPFGKVVAIYGPNAYCGVTHLIQKLSDGIIIYVPSRGKLIPSMCTEYMEIHGINWDKEIYLESHRKEYEERLSVWREDHRRKGSDETVTTIAFLAASS